MSFEEPGNGHGDDGEFWALQKQIDALRSLIDGQQNQIEILTKLDATRDKQIDTLHTMIKAQSELIDVLRLTLERILKRLAAPRP